MTPRTSARPTRAARARLSVSTCLLALLVCGLHAGGAAAGQASASSYPSGGVYAIKSPAGALRHSRAALAHGAAVTGGTGAAAAPATSHGKAKAPVSRPGLRGDPARALLAFKAMQKYFYIGGGTGLYRGEPYSFLWPFSQAMAATVSLANIPGQSTGLARELSARLYGLRAYWGAPLPYTAFGATTATSLRSYNGEVAPPRGSGGASYYDDNEWVGIELMRMYELNHNVTALAQAEQIMAFVMAGWQEDPEFSCPGGLPFSNAENNTDRNTVTDGPAAELGVQLYRVTHDQRYLAFSEKAYEWVRACLMTPAGLYADHIEARGEIVPTLWSYNQGSMMGAGTLLYQATHNSAYLFQARQTARAATAYFTPARLAIENPFFVSVYFRNLLYLDSVTHDPPGRKVAQAYVDEAWQSFRLSSGLFVSGAPAVAQLLTQAAIVQIYALLSTAPASYF